MKKLILIMFLTSCANAGTHIMVGDVLPGGSTSYINNQNTLQSGATAYPDFIYVGSSVSIANGLTAGRSSNGTDFFAFDKTLARLRLTNGAVAIANSVPLILWNNNSLVGTYTGVGFAVGSSSVPTAYWYLDNNNNRLTMSDGSGNAACYFDTVTRNLHCNYGIETSTLTISIGGSSGQSVCWKTATTLGYCSSVVGAGGACTCN